MPTTLSCIPPVVPTAAGGAAVRLLQAGHMVVPSAIWVPHPLQKAIDFPSRDCATQPPDSGLSGPTRTPRKLSESAFQGKQNHKLPGCELPRSVIEADRAFAINMIPPVGGYLPEPGRGDER